MTQDQANRRTYISSTREEQARATRSRIIAAATELLLARGYAATTVADVARAAGVTSQTVYNSCGSKSALLKAVYEVAVVGDDDGVPLMGRPEVQAVREVTDARGLLMAYARLASRLAERVGPLAAMVEAGAAGGDPDLRELLETTRGERLTGSGRVLDRVVELGRLREGRTRDEAHDLVWAMVDGRLWELLVNHRGWTPDAYAAYLGEALADAILGPSSGPHHRRQPG